MKYEKIMKEKALEYLVEDFGLTFRESKNLIEKVLDENCDFTNGVSPQGEIEFSARIGFIDGEQVDRTLTVYYYQTEEDLEEIEELDNLTWESRYFTID